jgi:hypothetical protein
LMKMCEGWISPFFSARFVIRPCFTDEIVEIDVERFREREQRQVGRIPRTAFDPPQELDRQVSDFRDPFLGATARDPPTYEDIAEAFERIGRP